MSETRVPYVLIGLALVVYVGFGFTLAGPLGAVVTVLLLLLRASITTALGIGACFIAAELLSTNFGTLQSACVKLAAVALFPLAAGLLISLVSPILGGLSVVVLYLGLLQSFFDLELFELIAFVLILWGVSWLAEQAIGWLLALVALSL